MSAGYRAIGWNRQKVVYDLTFFAGLVLYLTAFLGAGALLHPEATLETLLIRAFGTAALLFLHVVLSIGPLCRLDPRLLPLLYNRRHLGVATFMTSAAHAVFALVQFHALGNVNPFVSVLTANPRYDSLSQFPFEIPGLVALAILFCMAATSHDFWLANLTAPVWKSLHMAVYVAYALIVMHVTLGVLQAESSPWLAGTLGVGLVWILGLQVASGLRERAGDREVDARAVDDGYVEICRVGDLREKHGRSFCLGGERIAVFKYDGRVSAVSGVCQHQNGPLGEGRIRDGCITCPWHGYQYDPVTGASPPPFTEAIPVFHVRVEGDRVLVHPRPEPGGTFVAPASVVGERST